MNIGQAYVSMDMDCPQASSGKKADKAKKKNSETPPENPGTEIIRMKKIDDNTFLLQKTQNRLFKDEGSPVAYCPEDIQRLHAVKETRN